MKVSLITVAYNSGKFIQDCMDSVLGQDYEDIEYIIIDGKSSDNTVELVQAKGDKISHFVSEPDKGIYDAMNKGLKLASGDIIGILNSDDFYANSQVISDVVNTFKSENCDTLFGDLVFVQDEDLDKIVRYYPGKGFHPTQFAKGMMPPHPTFFAKKKVYEKVGLFDDSYKICADFDILVRMLHVHKYSY